jgi:hypothetical protein
MEDTFLKEQLQRIRRLSEHISEAYDRLGWQPANPGKQTTHPGPLQVRDYRLLQTQDYSAADERYPSPEHYRKTRHSNTPRRRRRG